MEFIDRKKEIARITRSLESGKRRFIVVYGRRRLGKSTLIKKCLREKDVYFEADLNEPFMQIQLLVNTIRMTYSSFGNARFDSWDDVLLHFNAICPEGTTLCLDEFPYLVKKTPYLPSILQRLLDSDELRFNLIICGSSQRMMENLILKSSEPLYGRADEKICLKPIPLPYWQDAFKMPAKNTIEEFSVWGGVPRYWKLREDYSDLWDAMENLILDEHGILADEPNALFLDQTAEIAPYSSLMTAIGSGHTRYSQLADAVGRKVSDLSEPLKNLREMSYIEKDVPFGEDIEKSRKTLYRFADPFMAFYYRFIAPNKSFLALGRHQRIIELIKNEFNMHVGYVWEQCCRHAVSGNELFGHSWGFASRWWGTVPTFSEDGKRTGSEDIEFDIVAQSIDKKRLMIGECKWAAPDYLDRLYRTMKNKVSKVREFNNNDIKYLLFLREKPKPGPIPEDVKILLPEDVIALLRQ